MSYSSLPELCKVCHCRADVQEAMIFQTAFFDITVGLTMMDQFCEKVTERQLVSTKHGLQAKQFSVR